MRFIKTLMTAALAALALLFGVSAHAQDAPADSVEVGDDVVSIYGGLAGGVGWADGEANDTYTGSVLVFTSLARGASIVLEYESDVDEMPLDVGEGDPDATLAKIGVAYRSERYGVIASVVRDGQASDSPESGPEVSGILAVGKEKDRWSTFVRITYVNTDESTARVGIYGRL